MFDIGFTELIVIGVVALIVIGPERLPKVARTAGHLYGRLQRYVSTVRSDISREIQLDELRRAGQSFKDSVESVASDVQQQATVVDDYLRSETDTISKEVRAIAATDGDHAGPPTVTRQPEVSQTPQQSLPLDEPDQNGAPAAPAAVVETARGRAPETPA
jgi:sec-independent protein translocase protein TatB